MSASQLSERYGRTPRDTRRRLVIGIGFGLAIVVVFAAWAIWAGFFQPTASIETQDVGNVKVSDNQMQVRWELSVDPGKTTSCAVQALNKDFGIVGWKIVKLPAVGVRSRTLSAIVTTSEPAVSGLIYRCWLT